MTAVPEMGGGSASSGVGADGDSKHLVLAAGRDGGQAPAGGKKRGRAAGDKEQARERKKAYMTELEVKAKELELRNDELEQKVSTLENENNMLGQETSGIGARSCTCASSSCSCTRFSCSCTRSFSWILMAWRAPPGVGKVHLLLREVLLLVDEILLVGLAEARIWPRQRGDERGGDDPGDGRRGARAPEEPRRRRSARNGEDLAEARRRWAGRR